MLEAVVGDYVIVHVGFALSKLDEEAAWRTLETYADWRLLIRIEGLNYEARLPSGH